VTIGGETGRASDEEPEAVVGWMEAEGQANVERICCTSTFLSARSVVVVFPVGGNGETQAV
jgi:hypothetical protein